MFRYDEDMDELIFDYCRMRLSFDPVTLDFSGEKEALDAVLAGLMRPEGNDPAKVLAVFADHLAPAVISCDSPRFLAFIPAAPTRASMLFDMIVSCSSLQGSSWLEAAGAVAAENQALRVLADLAGLPPGAGGVFVSGGSAANLSALAVARDTAAASRRGDRATASGGRERPDTLFGPQRPPDPRHGRIRRAHEEPPAHRGQPSPGPGHDPTRRRGGRGGHGGHDQRRDRG
jgi:aromatic-L-amino-acid decarboxylase